MTFVAGIFLASLLGSTHCAAMCGAFVCAYTGQRNDTPAQLMPHAAYHAGRLASYALLGVMAGALGAGVERIGAFAGISRAAAILSGSLMVVWAASSIAASLGFRTTIAAPMWPQRMLGSLLIRARKTSPAARAGITGVLTTLLPCGWLYAFVATAAGTGSALAGAGVMAVFWLGTVPMLLAIGFGAQRMLGGFARRLPLASAVFVLVLGLLALAGKMKPATLVAMDHTQHAAEQQ